MTNRKSIPSSPSFEALTQNARFRDRIAIRVQTSPDAIFRALREVTLADMKIAHLLGQIRYLPSRLAGHPPSGDLQQPFFSILMENGTLVLQDQSPREIITGSAGRLHRIVDQAPVRFDSRQAFDAFDDPGYEKLFMSLRMAPTGLPRA